MSGAKYALYLVLIPILAFFFLKDGRDIRDELVSALVEERRRPVVDNILEDINLLLGEYIRALVLLSVASFTAQQPLPGFQRSALRSPAGRRCRRSASSYPWWGRRPPV